MTAAQQCAAEAGARSEAIAQVGENITFARQLGGVYNEAAGDLAGQMDTLKLMAGMLRRAAAAADELRELIGGAS